MTQPSALCQKSCVFTRKILVTGKINFHLLLCILMNSHFNYSKASSLKHRWFFKWQSFFYLNISFMHENRCTFLLSEIWIFCLFYIMSRIWQRGLKLHPHAGTRELQQSFPNIWFKSTSKFSLIFLHSFYLINGWNAWSGEFQKIGEMSKVMSLKLFFVQQTHKYKICLQLN